MSNVASLFQYPNGTPYKFFVEAAAVRGRPAIVRKIASHGGRIVTRPRESDILLAENYTREAVELLEAWSGEKVVLSTRWIARCIESNMFLGAEVNWGGCFLDMDSVANGPDDGEAPHASPAAAASFPSPSKRRKFPNLEEPIAPLPSPPPGPLPPQPQFTTDPLALTYPSSSQPNALAQSALLASMLSQPGTRQWDMMNLLPLLALGQLNNPQLLAAQLHEAADRLGQMPASSPTQAVPSTPLASQSSPVGTSAPPEESITVFNRKRKSREGEHDPAPSPEYKEGIFTQEGKSMTFYIMLDISQRKQVLQLVRKHGGKIVMKMDEADHIILNNRSSQFQKIYELVPIGKIALSHGWLDKCDQEGALVPKAPYILDATLGIGRGLLRRKIKTPSSKRKCSKELDERDYDSEESNSVAYPAGMASSSQRPSERSPSPPIPGGTRSNVFTVADREWFFRYVRAKFEQKPEISWTALAKMVARKAPYHTATSWHNVARTRWTDEYQLLSREQTRHLMQRYPKREIAFQTPTNGKTIQTPSKEANSTTPSTSQHTNQPSTPVKGEPEEESLQLDQLFNERG